MSLIISTKDDASVQPSYLFVYGTLRSAFASDEHKKYLANADFVSPAKIRGKLFMVDAYPGLVPFDSIYSESSLSAPALAESEAWTHGEIYLLENESMFHALDVYEGCAKNSPQPHEYKREALAVVLRSGEIIEAWVYVYQLETSNLTLIDSGDFLQKQ